MKKLWRLALASMAAGLLMVSAGAWAKTVTLSVLLWDAYGGQEKPVWAAFEKAYPNIKIKPVIVPGDSVDDKFVAMRAGNIPVDVFFNYAVYGWATYANNGLFVDLGPYLKRDAKSFPKDLLPIATNCLKYGGRTVGLLLNAMGASGVWYNERLLQEAGLPLLPNSWEDASWNWDKFVEYSKKLTRVDSSGKYTQMGVDFWLADNIIQFCWSFGGDWFPKDAYELGYTQKTTIDTPQNVKAFQAIRDLKFKYFCSPSSETKGYSSSGWPDLYKNKLAMWIDPIQTGAAPPKGIKNAGKLAFAPMPVVPGVGRVDGFAWLEGMAMCKGTKYPNEAWTFMKWMMTDSALNGNMRFPGNGVRRSAWSKTFNNADDYFDVVRSKPVVDGSLERIRSFPRCCILGAKQVYDTVTARISPCLNTKNAPDIAQQLGLAAKDANAIMSRMLIRAQRQKK